MEENIAKFGEKLKQLVAHGKKNKSILELQEINDFFSDMELDAEQMEKVYEYLEANHIDVLRVSGDGDGIEELDDVDDSDIVLTDEDDVDMEKIVIFFVLLRIVLTSSFPSFIWIGNIE